MPPTLFLSGREQEGEKGEQKRLATGTGSAGSAGRSQGTQRVLR